MTFPTRCKRGRGISASFHAVCGQQSVVGRCVASRGKCRPSRRVGQSEPANLREKFGLTGSRLPQDLTRCGEMDRCAASRA